MNTTKSENIKESGVRPIDAAGICDIIKASKRYGVKSIKYGDLSIDFSEESDNIANTNSKTIEHIEAIDRKDQMDSNDEDVEDITAMLLIEDPMRYEELQLGEDRIV